MTANDAPVGQDGEETASSGTFEWLADDDWWTLVPVDVTGDDRLTRWISVESELLCDVEEWR